MSEEFENDVKPSPAFKVILVGGFVLVFLAMLFASLVPSAVERHYNPPKTPLPIADENPLEKGFKDAAKRERQEAYNSLRNEGMNPQEAEDGVKFLEKSREDGVKVLEQLKKQFNESERKKQKGY